MPVKNVDYERVAKCGEKAFRILRKAEIPPYPHYYELLYTYASGINPALNSQLNSFLNDGRNPSLAEVDKLYIQYLHSRDLEARVRTASVEVSGKIDAVHGAIDEALDVANSYTTTLAAASKDLTDGRSGDAIADITQTLLRGTATMQAANRALEVRLEESRNEIVALKQDLDEARAESLIDPLTKIFNRKYFDETLSLVLRESRESGSPFSLLMFDIDHFKAFNDTFGHQTGDQVLRLVASTIKSSVKSTDTAARYGGEEFAIIMPNTEIAEARLIGQSILSAIESKELLRRTTNEKLGRVTASIGLAVYRVGDSEESIVGRADALLYAAKRAGRNCLISTDETANTQGRKKAG